jgi:hypothetical protein
MAAAYAPSRRSSCPSSPSPPRITQSLHPQTVINREGRILMDNPTRVVFFAGLIGMTALFFWMLSLESRVARLNREA